MLLPWMLLSILASVFVDMFAKEKFRYEFGQKLGLGSLCFEEEEGENLLSWCKAGRAGIVEILVKHGKASDLNKTDDEGLTGLHWACKEGRVETVKMLVTQPTINVNVKDANGVTPIYTAYVCDHKNVMEFLQTQGIDANGKGFFFNFGLGNITHFSQFVDKIYKK